jgi:hypothetical protein
MSICPDLHSVMEQATNTGLSSRAESITVQ